MQEDAYARLVEVTKRYALLAETLERNATAAAEQHARTAAALQQQVERSQQALQGQAQQADRLLREQVERTVSQVLGNGVRQFDDALQDAARHAGATGEQLRTEQAVLVSGLQRAYRRAQWVAFASIGLLLLGGAGLLYFEHAAYRQARDRTAAAEVEAEMAEAMAKANVTSCGGTPCLKLDQDTPRWGKDGEYVLLK